MAVSSRDKRAAIREAVRLLGVRTGATVEDVILARRVQAKVWHPDVNPATGSAARMGLINSACDLLCDVIRKGGTIDGVPGPRTVRARRPAPEPAPRIFEVRFEEEIGAPVRSPDRTARLELDLLDAIEGGTRTVRFVRREPGRCQACAGIGASPAGPKRTCPDCGGHMSIVCETCEGRGWVHVFPGSCRRCDGTGAGLVERSVRLLLPPGIREVRRTMVPGWGDLDEDGASGNLWIDLVPSPTAMRSGEWRFAYFGHDWPRAQARVDGDWVAISNQPLPDDEMRELGFWRDVASAEWVRQAPAEGAEVLFDLIQQRQMFVTRG